MNIITKYFWQILLIIAIVIIFLQRSCYRSVSNTPITIITEEKKGSFESIKPKEIIREKKFPVYINGDTLYLKNPVDSTLANKYKNERDSIQRRIMYLEAIQKRRYAGIFVRKQNCKQRIFG